VGRLIYWGIKNQPGSETIALNFDQHPFGKNSVADQEGRSYTNMLSLPVPDNLANECHRHRLISRILAVVAGPVASLFAVVNIADGYLMEALADGFLALLAGALWLAAKPDKDLRKSYIRMQTLLLLFVVCFASLEIYSVFGEQRYSRLLWFIPFPLLVFFTLGKRVGLVFVLCLTAALGVLLNINLGQATGVWFEANDSWRFLGAFMAMCLAGFFIELSLRRDRNSLMEKQCALARSEELYREACLNLVQEINKRNQVEISQQGLVEQVRQGQKMEALGQLAGGVVHDFNNLLGSMMGFTHMAHKALPDDHIQKENLSLALTAGKKAQLLLRRLLDFSRHEEPDREPLYLGNLVRGGLELAGPLLAPGVHLETSLPEDPRDELAVKANAIQLEQVLFNLCKNASQAMAHKGGILTVELSKRDLDKRKAGMLDLAPGDYALLKVCDSGPGLSLGALENAFDPFYTTKDKGKGTGMGLFVTRGIVEAHHGRITVRNRSKGGAKFSVYLPLCHEKPVEQTASEPALMPQGQGQRVLYVDDDHALATTVRMVLEELGYQIEICGSAEEALGKLHSGKINIDLLISDQNMGGKSGEDLARECRRLYPELPVIITTGSASLLDSHKLKDLGISDILAKPVSAQRIAQAIDQALKQSSAAGALPLEL
jgi:signal transduction histidine kinase/CheY-like chemotaxis protein